MKGRKHSDETRKKLSISHLKLYEDPKECKKISDGVTELWKDPEYRKKQLISQEKRWDDPKEHKKMSEIQLERFGDNPVSDKTRKKMSTSGKKRHEDYPFTDKTITKMSNHAIERYEDPEERDKQSEMQTKRYAEMDDPGMEICGHHIAYDFGRPDAFVVQITRRRHAQIHNPKGQKVCEFGYSLID